MILTSSKHNHPHSALPPSKCDFFVPLGLSSSMYISNYINSLWPTGAWWHYRTLSTLHYRMASCLTAASHCLNQLSVRCYGTLTHIKEIWPEYRWLNDTPEMLLWALLGIWWHYYVIQFYHSCKHCCYKYVFTKYFFFYQKIFFII